MKGGFEGVGPNDKRSRGIMTPKVTRVGDKGGSYFLYPTLIESEARVHPRG